MVVTDRRVFPEPVAGEPVAAAELAVWRDLITARPGLVQLREKDLTGGPLLARAAALGELCRSAQVRWVVNDRADVARLAGADGVHLPAAGMAAADARTVALCGPAGERPLVGRSVHGLDEALAAAQEGVDYVVFGPVFETPAKRAFGAPQGLDRLARVCAACPVPVIGIGGVSIATASAVMAHGAAGVGVVRAVLAATSPGAAVRALVATLRESQ